MSKRDIHATHDTDEYRLLAASVKTLQEAAQLALSAKGPGDPIFKFARAIKAFELTTTTRLPDKELESAFNVWWKLAKEHLGFLEADREENLFLFLDDYPRVKTALGSNALEIAIQRMETGKPPPEAKPYTSPKLKSLVHLCSELQKIQGDLPFFLSINGAGRVINCKSNFTTSALINGLVRDGLLTVIELGVPGGPRATRFKFSFGGQKQ